MVKYKRDEQTSKNEFNHEQRHERGCNGMNKANGHEIENERTDVEMMSNGTLKKLIEYLHSVGWSDSQIVELLDYIASK